MDKFCFFALTWNIFFQQIYCVIRGAIKIDFRKNLGFWPNQRIRKWCLTLHTFRRKIYRLSFWDESIVNSDHNCAQNSSKLVSNTIQILVFDATYSSIIWNWNIHVQQIAHTNKTALFQGTVITSWYIQIKRTHYTLSLAGAHSKYKLTYQLYTNEMGTLSVEGVTSSMDSTSSHNQNFWSTHKLSLQTQFLAPCWDPRKEHYENKSCFMDKWPNLQIYGHTSSAYALRRALRLLFSCER